MNRIVLIESDPDLLLLGRSTLEYVGYEVFVASDGASGLELVRKHRPDLAVIDLLSSGKHGFAVCQEIRNDPELRRVKIVATSIKTYASDIKKAREVGADEVLPKPYRPDELLVSVRGLLNPGGPEIMIRFWGTRGSIPTPGAATMRYGGNTSCVEVRCGGHILMFDCGTGAREMGVALSREFKGRRMDLHVFMSHTHWDHIQGFPFFTPAYVPGNHLSLYSLRGADKSLEKVFTGQMDSAYFPVAMSDLNAHMHFVELDGPIVLGPMTITHIPLNHPGLAIGFRIQVGPKSVVYCTDHESYCSLLGESEHNRKLDREVTEFARGADLYIREAQYTDDEYPLKRGWGHSTYTDALNAAHEAGVRDLALFHHEPMHDDEAIDRIVADCRAYMKQHGMTFNCFAAADNQVINV